MPSIAKDRILLDSRNLGYMQPIWHSLGQRESVPHAVTLSFISGLTPQKNSLGS